MIKIYLLLKEGSFYYRLEEIFKMFDTYAYLKSTKIDARLTKGKFFEGYPLKKAFLTFYLLNKWT